MKLSTHDLIVLHHAADVLENPSFSSRITKTVGGAVEKTIAILPAQVSLSLNDITRTALEKSLEGAIFTLNSRRSSIPFNKTHKFFAGLSGAVGGAVGGVDPSPSSRQKLNGTDYNLRCPDSPCVHS
jgi:hypothetical protein